MHASSYDKMKFFRENYLSGKEDTNLKIIDLGSTDIYGCYRPIFNEAAWDYTGVDLASGTNVDLVLSDPYNWLEIDSESVDVFISGQTFEHIEYFWETILEINRILKPGGLCCIIAPSGGPEHRYPLDCWRFYSDGFKSLARYAKLDALYVKTQWEPEGYDDGGDVWADSILIAKKPEIKKGNDDKVLTDQRIIRENDDKDSLSKIIEILTPESYILELGPAEGYLTKCMYEQLNCRIDCVEISPEMARITKKYCNRMVIGDLDEMDLGSHFKSGSYDFVIIADVLEHIKEDKKTLTACRNLLKDNGKLIVSVPNIAHSSIIGSLLKGQFEYRDQGLLDPTHIKFYTRESIQALLTKCQFQMDNVDTVSILPEETEIGDSLTDLPFDLQNVILNRPDSLTYQFIITCRPSKGKVSGIPNTNFPSVSAVDLRKANLESMNQRIAELDLELESSKKLADERISTINNMDDKVMALKSELSKNENKVQSISDLNNKLANAEKMAEERLNKMDDCYNQIDRLKADIGNYQMVLHRVHTHPAYRIYRKLKDLLWRREN